MRIDITIPDEATPGRHGVYVAYDGNRNVLYIGRTQNLRARIMGHRSQSAWFRQMRDLEWSPCEGPNEARLFEKQLIAAFRPNGNINDFKEPTGSARQKLPDWTVAKLVELHESCDRGDEASNQTLNDYIAALRGAGWTLAAIGFGLSVTREAVRLRAIKGNASHCRTGIPQIPVKVKPEKKVKPSIPADVLAVMLELKQQARRVNGPTPADSPLRTASVRYTEMIAEQYVAGVSIYRMSKQLGVTHLAIRARLARHGYMEPVKGLPSNVTYGEREWHPPTRMLENGACFRGHPMNDENVRFINGDQSRPVCRTCERQRSDRYRAKHGRVRDPIRQWAMAEGIPVNRTGVVPGHIRELYEAATAQEAS